MKTITIILISFLLSHIVVGQTPADMTAIEDFAPQLRLHPDDNHKTSSAEWFIDRSRLDFKGENDVNAIILSGDISSSNLNDQTKELQHSASGYPTFFELNLDDPHREGDLNSTKVYVTWKKVFNAKSFVDIQYWFFYPYNDGRSIITEGEHEGDWEHITVRIDYKAYLNNGSVPLASHIQKVYYAAHEDLGRWYLPNEISTTNSTHPIVYSANESHASYPTIGSFDAPGPGICDETKNGGDYIDNWLNNKIVLIAEYPYNAPCDITYSPYWVNYTGRWGEGSSGIFYSPKGPRNPVLQAKYRSDDVPNNDLGIVFYDDINGTGGHKGTTNYFSGQAFDLNHFDDIGAHDDIASLRINYAPRGTEIRLYDESDGSTSDDYAIIQVKRDIFYESYLIGDLEQSFDNNDVKLTYCCGGNLEEKVSRIEIGRFLDCCEDHLTITNAWQTGSHLDYREADVSIIALNHVEAHEEVIYHAGEEVIFKDGFYSLKGSDAWAFIEGCTGNFSVSPNSALRKKKNTSIINFEQEKLGLLIYPNPANQTLQLEFNNEEKQPATIIITDITGKEIVRDITLQGRYTLTTGDFLNGIYAISVQVNKQIFAEKFIVKH